MSYEGYTQYLCEKGHLTTLDCHSDLDLCACNSKMAWINQVDETNGCEATTQEHKSGKRCPSCGYVELKLEKPLNTCRCVCGNEHLKEWPVYVIPEKNPA
jgi:hypothetical protein